MEVATAVVQSRALTLPLSLPKLSTAALVPTLVVVFSAETWDVGLNITDGTAALFAVGSILLAAVYLLFRTTSCSRAGANRCSPNTSRW